MRFLLILFVVFATPAGAQFTSTPNNNWPTTGNSIDFECGVLNRGARPDADPVYKTSVHITRDKDSGSFDTMEVIHFTVFGNTYTRSEQYTNGQLINVPGKLELKWIGTRKKGPGRMLGRIWNDASSGRWFYSEHYNSDNNLVILSGCLSTGKKD